MSKHTAGSGEGARTERPIDQLWKEENEDTEAPGSGEGAETVIRRKLNCEASRGRGDEHCEVTRSTKVKVRTLESTSTESTEGKRCRSRREEKGLGKGPRGRAREKDWEEGFGSREITVTETTHPRGSKAYMASQKTSFKKSMRAEK